MLDDATSLLPAEATGNTCGQCSTLSKQQHHRLKQCAKQEVAIFRQTEQIFNGIQISNKGHYGAKNFNTAPISVTMYTL